MNENPSEEVESSTSVEKILFAAFLESTPPGTVADIADLFDLNKKYRVVPYPDIQLHCDYDTCQGARFFACCDEEEQDVADKVDTPAFLNYECRNCGITKKLFAISLLFDESNSTTTSGRAIKLGEFPSFGPPIPSRVITLIGPDREIFIRGRRAENQGLGIGAFAYYRRVVENQKGRLITEIAKVAKRLGATPEELSTFETAAKETQFSKAIDSVKNAIPQVLLISGHNPLVLLHSALSEGLHAGTDEECLELATSVRVVLTELAERISQALKDEAELKHAISKLLQPRISRRNQGSK
jgi:hypothetical protein